MKPATTSLDNTDFSVQKLIVRPECISKRLIFKFALWAGKISILDALATLFHEKSGLVDFNLRAALIFAFARGVVLNRQQIDNPTPNALFDLQTPYGTASTSFWTVEFGASTPAPD